MCFRVYSTETKSASLLHTKIRYGLVEFLIFLVAYADMLGLSYIHGLVASVIILVACAASFIVLRRLVL